jgi:hypothetical protein
MPSQPRETFLDLNVVDLNNYLETLRAQYDKVTTRINDAKKEQAWLKKTIERIEKYRDQAYGPGGEPFPVPQAYLEQEKDSSPSEK